MNWKLRIDRIHRLKEKGEFDRVVMPLSYLGMGIGFLALCWVGIARLDGGKMHPVALVLGLFFFVLPPDFDSDSLFSRAFQQAPHRIELIFRDFPLPKSGAG